MREARKPWESASTLDSVVFSIMMALAAYLGRENPYFVYPHILWGFLALLAFNLANFSLLSNRLGPAQRLLLPVMINTLCITLILCYSGGRQSYFWVMYLLPIFTASLSYGRRALLVLLGGVMALVALFYADSMRRRAWIEIFEMLIKMTTLIASAGVTMRVAMRERRMQELLMEEQASSTRERMAMREKFQHMDRLATLGTLLAGIAHELKNPLTSILGFAQLALSGQPSEAELQEIMRRIEGSVRRCRQTIQDMLAFSRKESERRACDVNALIHECVELKRYDWVGGNIRAEESYDPGLGPLSLSGPELQQVVFNLLTNAEHAILSKSAGQGRIRVRTETAPGGVRVAVEDDGPGIPPEILDRIWEPFFTTKPAGQGTGLGLSICRQIVEGQGGRLSARSPAGRGAVFEIVLPLEAPMGEPTGSPGGL